MREEFRKMWLGPFTWTLKLGCLTNFLGKMWLGPFTWTLKLGCLTNFFRKNVAWAVYMDPKIRLFDEFFFGKMWLGPFTWTLKLGCLMNFLGKMRLKPFFGI